VAVDTAPPSGSVKIDSGAAWTDTPSVSLNLTCSDARSACVAMQLSNDNVTFTPFEPFAATRTWTLAGNGATRTVYVRYLDRAGNVSRSFLDTITLDTAAPVVGAVTATPNPFAPQLGQTTTIRIPVSDNLSASCFLKIRILDAAGGLVKSMALTVTCPPASATTSVVWDGRNAAGVRVPGGPYTIEVAATDRAGNAGVIARGTVVAQ
jgi:FlgD Ig-like domain